MAADNGRNMKKVTEAFEAAFGIPFPDAMLPPGEVAPIRGIPLLLGSPSACERPLLPQASLDEFEESAPDGYYACGFWGYGINSYCFHYAKVEGGARVFFRLPYGNAFAGRDDEAAAIREFLPPYFEFEARLRRSGLERLVAVDSMGSATDRRSLFGPYASTVTVML